MYGSLNSVWPYAAAVTIVLAIALIGLYRFGTTGARRGNAWKYTEEIHQIRKLMGQTRYDEAAALVEPLLRRQDITGEFFDVAAIIAERRGKLDEAARHWRDLQRYYPEDAWGYMRNARVLLRQGKVRQAHRLLDLARKRVKHSGQLDSVLAEAAQAAKRWNEAIERWAKLRETAPGEVSGYLEGRKCLLAVGRRAEADALLVDVSIRMPSHPSVQHALKAAEKDSG